MCKDSDFSPQITRINTDYFIEKWSQNETGTFRNKKTGKNESFNAIPVNAKAAADITYTDAEDNTEKTTSRQAVQFSWDKSADAGFEQAE